MTLAQPTSSTTPSELEIAFQLLADVVAEQAEQGRSLHAASLKPLLVKRSAGGFSDRALGFASFYAFLVAARDKTWIDLRPAGTTPNDVVVVPLVPASGADAAPVGEPSRGYGASKPRHIRSDLWAAFVNWDSGFKRVYDRNRDRAGTIPRGGGAA